MATRELITSPDAYIAARKEIEDRYSAGATLASLEEYAEHLPFTRDERDSLKLLALSITSEPIPRYEVRYGMLGYQLRPMRAVRDPLHREC